MNKVALLIPAHCRPEILKLTLGTWLERYEGEYEARVYVSLHKNYSHYCNALDEITSMLNVEVVFVDEIFWCEADMLRYSRMHARCIMTLLRKALEWECDNLAILDHDLIFKDDFVGMCLKEYPGSDLMCGLMNDRDKSVDILTSNGVLKFSVKPTVWHLIISRAFAKRLVSERDLVMPDKNGNVIFDTFSRGYKAALSEDMKVDILPCQKLEKWVEHLWSLSFNMHSADSYKSGDEKYNEKVDRFVREYNERFPDGIDGLLEKLK